LASAADSVSRGRGVQALWPGGEIARGERIERAAGDVVIDLRIPRPSAERLGIPDVVAQRVVEQGRVDLLLARERLAVDPLEIGEHRLRERRALGATGRRHVGDLRVEAVIAKRGRGRRIEPREAVDIALRQRRERGALRSLRGERGGGHRRNGERQDRGAEEQAEFTHHEFLTISAAVRCRAAC
jgi:hypothetical protein